MFTLGSIFVVLSFFYGLNKLIDEAWMQPAEKKRFHERVAEVWVALAGSDAKAVIQAPIRLVAYLLRLIYGERIFSLKSFARSSLVTLIFFLTAAGCIEIGGGEVVPTFSQAEKFDLLFDVASGMPDYSEGKMPAVWKKYFDAAGKPSPKLLSPQQISPEWKGRIRTFTATLLSYNTPTNRTTYLLLFPICTLMVVSALSFFAVAFARQSLDDMAEAKSLVSVFSLCVGNVFFLACLICGGLMILLTVAEPFWWLMLWGCGYVGTHTSWILAFTILLPFLLLGLLVFPTWIQIFVGLIITPQLIVIAMAVLACALYPLRKPIRRVMVEFLDRGLSYKSGFLGFSAVMLASTVSLTVGISRFLNGKLLQ